MKPKKKNKRWMPRIPTPKPTEWHRDKSKYNRKEKHKNDGDG